MPSTSARLGPLLRVARLSDFDPADNGITAARLLLALAVVVSHSFPLTDNPEPLRPQTGDKLSLGFLAVIAFFTLSGFLLARSRERTPVLAFVRNRALRVFPAFWLALLFGAFAAAPLGAALAGRTVDLADAAAYVTSHAFMQFGGQTEIAGAFSGNPIQAVNGALWTLSFEMLGYVALALTPRRWLRPLVVGLAVMLFLAMSASAVIGWPALLLAFTIGVGAWSWRDRIPMSVVSVWVAAFLFVITIAAGALTWAVIVTAFLALALAWLPIRLDRDLSYGTYALAFPVQQMLVSAGTLAAGPLIVLAVAVVLPLAYLSWTLVETPALRLRSVRRSALPGSPGTSPPPSILGSPRAAPSTPP